MGMGGGGERISVDFEPLHGLYGLGDRLLDGCLVKIIFLLLGETPFSFFYTNAQLRK